MAKTYNSRFYMVRIYCHNSESIPHYILRMVEQVIKGIQVVKCNSGT